MSMPMITLTNGLRIANFSSPHPFNFEDGSVLPACDPERVKRGSLDVTEEEFCGIKSTIDIKITFSISESVAEMLEEAQSSEADVVLVPFPVLNAMRDEGRNLGKFRVVRIKDRQTKEVHIDRFCI